MMMLTLMMLFCVLAPCRLVRCLCFRETYFSHLQGWSGDGKWRDLYRVIGRESCGNGPITDEEFGGKVQANWESPSCLPPPSPTWRLPVSVDLSNSFISDWPIPSAFPFSNPIQVPPLPHIATSTLKMETVCFSETLAFNYESAWCQNLEQQHCSFPFCLVSHIKGWT
jgi:hypothetical protein